MTVTNPENDGILFVIHAFNLIDLQHVQSFVDLHTEIQVKTELTVRVDS